MDFNEFLYQSILAAQSRNEPAIRAAEEAAKAYKAGMDALTANTGGMCEQMSADEVRAHKLAAIDRLMADIKDVLTTSPTPH